MNSDNDSIVEDYEMGEFVSCVIVNEEMQLVEVLFEDVPYISQPIFPGIYHYFDKYLAVDDQRIVGACLWHTPALMKEEEKEEETTYLYQISIVFLTVYSIIVTFLFLTSLGH